MKKELIDAGVPTLRDLPRGSLVEDRFGDHFLRGEDCPAGSDRWMSHETALMGGKYISKHYAPLYLVVAFEPGDSLNWPESAMSVPLDTLVRTASGDVYAKIGSDSWMKKTGRTQRPITSKKLLCGTTTITVIHG